MAFLTIERRAGTRGHGQVNAGTKAAQQEGIARKRVTARGGGCPRWCSLSVPFTKPAGAEASSGEGTLAQAKAGPAHLDRGPLPEETRAGVSLR